MPAVIITLDATAMLGPRTGVGRYVSALVAALGPALARRGAAADVRVTTWTLRAGRVPGLPAGTRQVGPRVPARLLRAAWSRTSVPPVELLIGRTDVVHGTNFVSPPTRAAREVVTVHDLTYEFHADTVDPASLAYRELVPRALRRGAHAVTPSDAVTRAVRELYGLGADQVTTTPLGVDPSWSDASPPDAAWFGGRGLPRDYLLFVGSPGPRKNLSRLLAAHRAARAGGADLPDLVLAGPAGRDGSLGDSPGVHATGWLHDDELRALVAGSRALVLPSLDEGFGLPVLEAAAAGRPVVVSDLPVMHEVAAPDAVFADPLDVDALAQALLDVVARDDSPHARAARRAAAAPFTWDRTADRTLDVYAAVLR